MIENSTENTWRMPAEWERHEATWLVWPHTHFDWPGKTNVVPWAFAEMARKIAPGETVRIVADSKSIEARARRALERAGVDLGRIVFRRWRTESCWARDFGPIVVKRGSERAIARFHFNHWARYELGPRDAKIPERVAKELGLPLRPITRGGEFVVLEGGALDVNGRGTLLTTEETLLDPVTQVRNPGFTREIYEDVLCEALGATNVLWLGRGIAGDDTHGHVDDLCRFVNPNTVVCVRESDSSDVNYRPLEENLERLQSMRLEDGSALNVVELPMPRPLYFDGDRLPASYANFYITNAAVLVPTFNDPADRIALGILSECFPDRPVVGIHCVDLIWGLGSLHCLTQQLPA